MEQQRAGQVPPRTGRRLLPTTAVQATAAVQLDQGSLTSLCNSVIACYSAASTMIEAAKTRHPQGLYILFFAELWERFSFYGMRALLTLYMVKQLAYGDEKAFGVYAAYGAIVYTFPILGGYLADRLLGYRKAIILGGILMALGHFAMAIENDIFFYGALALLCVGNGFFKPNISSLVGKLYEEGDPRRDGGFTIFYMGINIGAFLSPLACGYIGETWGWHYGFGLAGIGMLAGLGVFLYGQARFGDRGLPPDPAALSIPVVPGLSRAHAVYAGSFLIVPIVGLLLVRNELVGSLLYIVGALVLVWLLSIAFRSDKVTRDRMFVIIILLPFSTAFWAAFEQAGSSISLFTDRNVDRTLFGSEVPASMFQSVNAIFIVALAPIFAAMWTGLGKRNRDPSIPMKFMLALVQMGLGFFCLAYGAAQGIDGKTGMIWLILGYLLHTTGELCLSPVGLSAMTKLAPSRVVGLVMGSWFLSTAFAHHFAGVIAKLTGGGGEGDTANLDPAVTIQIYGSVFNDVGWGAIGCAVVMLILTPLLKRWMHGVK